VAVLVLQDAHGVLLALGGGELGVREALLRPARGGHDQRVGNVTEATRTHCRPAPQRSCPCETIHARDTDLAISFMVACRLSRSALKSHPSRLLASASVLGDT